MLISGTAYKTYTSNRPIIAALLFSEVIQSGLPALGAIPAAYDIAPAAAKKALLITMLAAVIEVVFLALPTPPVVGSVAAATAIVKLVGEEEVIEAIRTSSTLGIGPETGYLYVFKDDTLGIPAGQYSINSISSISSESFLLQESGDWLQYVDWIAGIPNLSWVGKWEPMSPNVTALEAAFEGDLDAYRLWDQSESGNEEERAKESEKSPWAIPLLGVGLGLILLGGLKR